MSCKRLARVFTYPVLAILTATLSGCASGGNIQSDYDRTADFGSYRTYDFMEGAGPDYDDYQSFFTRYMIAAIEIEMEKGPVIP